MLLPARIYSFLSVNWVQSTACVAPVLGLLSRCADHLEGVCTFSSRYSGSLNGMFPKAREATTQTSHVSMKRKSYTAVQQLSVHSANLTSVMISAGLHIGWVTTTSPIAYEA